LTDGELFFLRASDHLDVRPSDSAMALSRHCRKLRTRLVAQQLPGLKQAPECRILDIDLVKAQAEAVVAARRDHPFTADPQAGKTHQLGITVQMPHQLPGASMLAASDVLLK
jgi:hypothetical protein